MSASPAPPAPTVGHPPPSRAYRSTEDRLLGGVAAGLAEHLALRPLHVRAAFLLLTIFGGIGIAAYAGFWMVLPTDTHLEKSSPGLEAATRQGKRQGRSRRLEDVGPLIALSAVAIGVVVLLQNLLGGSVLFWPVLLGVLGLAVLWRQADEAQRERWVDSTGRVDFFRAVVGRGGVASYARLGAGAVLLVGAMAVFAVQTGRSSVAGEVLLAAFLAVLGLALVIGPWLFRLVGDLSEERAARIRTEERADMAAHLHDSVLQTLALIQKHSGDGRVVATLARAQERDLRAWLYADDPAPDTSVSSALRAAAAEVEDAHGVPVEVVTVGDVPLTEPLRPLVLAAREAMVNAAKHSGAGQVDVFAEAQEHANPAAVDVFVRDRGKGFDEAEIPGDRLGVRHSIVDRMQRHGGSAEIRTAPGTGTEVRLRMTDTTPPTEEDPR
ncbi:MAG: PspC domain-containing protein [Nocardioidaceae bacterium]|nr:PspC domain-containing protein [Nocardioidaceae bacterium]NUS51554.1 PspC domain-containing protein [Nocardioidaceae bacterium]